MRLTRNFYKSEFDSRDGAEMPADVLSNVIKLAGELQKLRDHLGVPIHINSGYRSPAHNERIGGVSNSQHLFGKAADIVVKDMTPADVRRVIEALIDKGDMLQGGLSDYPGFVHYDIRGERARW
jgi:uncharacterized protein YcbK (DUF882 family)